MRGAPADRLKALAGAFQTVALSVFGVGILTPLLTTFPSLTFRQMVARGLTALAIEVISLIFLLYIPYAETEAEENTHG